MADAFDSRKNVEKRAVRVACFAGVVLALLGCAPSTGEDPGTGGTGESGSAGSSGAAGSKNSGGTNSTGGAGASGAGGTVASGGTTANGGTTPVAGKGGGGSASVAGAAGSLGGRSGSGGGDSGRAGGGSGGASAGLGGTANDGGTAGTGGAPNGGGAGTGPAGGSGGGGPRTSAGCGKATTLESGRATIDVAGTNREYILAIPEGYNPDTPYKLIFGLHWRGGQASDVATGGTVGLGNYYGLQDLADGSAIFVSPEGIDNGWANTGGRDIALMKAILARFDAELCVDLDRIFSVGFSYGGMMSFAIACEMGDVFRAIAPMSGALYSGCGNGTEPIAMFGTHGISDNVVPIGDGRTGLAEILERNHCSTTTTPVTPSPCVSYEGCDEGYPVTWCEFDGSHSPQRWSSQPVWDFFSGF
ncbi:MAG TPA: prolyl oligopeptidase family serine peptidase [Polyangiaceae bacterium]